MTDKRASGTGVPAASPSQQTRDRAASLAATAMPARPAALKRLDRLMHDTMQFRTAAASVPRRHSFLGRAHQCLDVGFPANQDRLLVLDREAGCGQHLAGREKYGLRIELGLLEVDCGGGHRGGSLCEV